MSLVDFERRMLRLKGIKLPSAGLKVTNHSSYGHQAIITANNSVGTILADIDQDYVHDEALDDIVTGVIRSFDVASSHKGNKLNVSVIRSMLHKLPIISSLAIEDNYGYSRAQAKRYAQACRLCVQFKSRHNVRRSFNQLALNAE